MKVRASIEPDVAPITPEMIAKLPMVPAERHRSQVVYYSREFGGDTGIDALLGVRQFIAKLLSLRDCFLEAFGVDYTTHLYLDGHGDVWLNHFDLADLVAIRATLCWSPSILDQQGYRVVPKVADQVVDRPTLWGDGI